jgi:hypothetical protein
MYTRNATGIFITTLVNFMYSKALHINVETRVKRAAGCILHWLHSPYCMLDYFSIRF